MAANEGSNMNGKAPEDKLRVMAALAAQPVGEATSCPSPEELAALVDGRVKPSDRQAILTHLDGCSQCYDDWLTVGALRSSARKPEEEKLVHLQKAASRRRRDRQGILWFSGMGLALAASLLLLLWWPNARPSALGDLVQESYQLASAGGVSLLGDRGRQVLPLPWERPTSFYGMTQHETSSDISRAFGAGLWAGRQQFTSQKETGPPPFLSPHPSGGTESLARWTEGPNAPYFILGRWSILMRAACQGGRDLPPSFWSLQAQVLDRMEEELSRRAGTEGEAKVAAAALLRLRPLLKDLPSGQPSASQCSRIGSEMESLAERLAPAQQP